MAIYWFDGQDVLHELQPLTSSKTALKAAIDGIQENISEDPSTDLYGAVIKSTDIAVGLLNEMIKRDLSLGLATACVGGGMGAAGLFEVL